MGQGDHHPRPLVAGGPPLLTETAAALVRGWGHSRGHCGSVGPEQWPTAAADRERDNWGEEGKIRTSGKGSQFI